MSLWAVETAPVELRAGYGEDDLQAVIRAVYKQVLGNAHILESDRLTSAESLLRDGDITVRGFVSLVANSDLYKSLFFERSAQYRFIELNFKHLLGRAPQDQAEVSAHVQTYNGAGYEAEIASYIDSDEYIQSFGENTVPYARGTKTQAGLKNVGFNRTFALLGGYASDDSSTQSALVTDLASNLATKIVAPQSISSGYNNRTKRFRIVARKGGTTPIMRRSNMTYTVDYAQLTQKIQSIQKTGGTIVSITEAA